jgi:hypothetical protein
MTRSPIFIFAGCSAGNPFRKPHPNLSSHLQLTAYSLKLSLSLPRLRKQPQDLKVQPHKRDHQTERAVPFHVFRSTALGHLLNKIKIEDKIKRSDGYHKKAKE